MPFYICRKLFHHAHNFEYTLQWAVHNPNINWLCEAVTLERKLKTKILSISSKEWMLRFANISVALLRHRLVEQKIGDNHECNLTMFTLI